MNLLKKTLFGAAALSMIAAGANADVLTLGGGWSTFYFQQADIFDAPYEASPFQDINGDAIEYDFTLTSNAFLKVTDAYYTGDWFAVTINGMDQGLTSTPTFDTVFTDDYDVAFHNPSWSSAAYYLTPGDYTVTGVAVYSPYGSGAGGIELASNTPEPATWALMLTGLGVVGGLARRKARKTIAA